MTASGAQDPILVIKDEDLQKFVPRAGKIELYEMSFDAGPPLNPHTGIVSVDGVLTEFGKTVHYKASDPIDKPASVNHKKSHCPWCDKMVEWRNDRPAPRDHKVRGRDSRFCVKKGQRRRARAKDSTGRYGEVY